MHNHGTYRVEYSVRIKSEVFPKAAHDETESATRSAFKGSKYHAARCENCEDYDQQCTYDRPVKKRGAKSKAEREAQQQQQQQQQQNQQAQQPDVDESQAQSSQSPLPQPLLDPCAHRRSPTYLHTSVSSASSRNSTNNNNSNTLNLPSIVAPPTIPHSYGQASNTPTLESPGLQASWRPPIVADHDRILELCHVYFEAIYPVFPLFIRATMLRRVSNYEYYHDRAFYANVMALCALTSARVRDRAIYSFRWRNTSIRQPSAETFFEAAQDAMPAHAQLSQTGSFEYSRACFLLAMTSMQFGQPDTTSYWLGTEYSLHAAAGFHDERNWPQSLEPNEIEERRRLFWTTYCLDVFNSIIWGSIIRNREAFSNVGYPAEILDETSLQSRAYNTMGQEEVVNWMMGFNFVTDLYRLLEHARDHIQARRASPDRTPFVRNPFLAAGPSHTAILEMVTSAYMTLPGRLRNVRQPTNNLTEDIYSFQAANISATIQLVRMVLFTAERSTVEQKCEITREITRSFASVPNAYLRGISAPLLHHLAGIGSILGSAFEERLSQQSYTMLRSSLLGLANFLANLEVDFCCPAGTADRLRAQVSRIDEHTIKQRQENASRHGGATTGRHDSADTSHILSDRTAGASGSTQFSDETLQFCFPPDLLKEWSWKYNVAP
ncbi:hypothetical protein MBLNU457_4568t2 [Dothideomycetes sp. NU457]